VRESDLERRVKKAAEGLGFLFLKTTCARGFPDRMILGRAAQIAFMELKQPGKKPRANQLHWMDRLNRYGFPARWVDNFEDAEEFLLDLQDQWNKEPKTP